MSGFFGGVWGDVMASRQAVEGAWAGAWHGLDGQGTASAFTGAAAQPLVQQAVADALQGALQRLQREDGLPGFVSGALQAQAAATVTAWEGPQSTQAQAQTQAAQANCGDALRAFSAELGDAIVQSTRQQLQAEASGGDGGVATRPGGGSWMLAIARAMGAVLGQKASRMVELSQQIQDLSSRSRGATSDGTAPPDDAGRAQQLLDAAESQRLNTEFQATGQEFNLLQTTYSTAMKTLGEGMAAMARRQ